MCIVKQCDWPTHFGNFENAELFSKQPSSDYNCIELRRKSLVHQSLIFGDRDLSTKECAVHSQEVSTRGYRYHRKSVREVKHSKM